MTRRSPDRGLEVHWNRQRGFAADTHLREVSAPLRWRTPSRGRILAAIAVLPLLFACQRGTDTAREAGVASSPEPLVCSPDVCSAEIGPPRVAQTEAPATISRPQSVGWTAVSNDAECAALRPVSVPPMVSWAAPESGWCDSPVVDGSHALGVTAGTFSNSSPARPVRPSLRVFTPEGAARAVSLEQSPSNTWSSHLLPRHRGFALLVNPHISAGVSCHFLRNVNPNGDTVQVIQREQYSRHVVANPLGGYVELIKRLDNTTQSFDVRWVDESFQPLSDWHTAFTTEPPYTNPDVAFAVDRSGKALVLARFYPPSFGPPLPPTSWRFAARWMEKDGPVGPLFEPVVPKALHPNGDVGFEGWGELIALSEGGIAAYRPPAWSADVTLTPPAGWYAWYPSGEARGASAPAWMKERDHLLQPLQGSHGYAAMRREPKTCAREVELIAPSGRVCFTLRLDGSDGCDAGDRLWPDGTLVVETQSPSCRLRWWPGVAQLAR